MKRYRTRFWIWVIAVILLIGWLGIEIVPRLFPKLPLEEYDRQILRLEKKLSPLRNSISLYYEEKEEKKEYVEYPFFDPEPSLELKKWMEKKRIIEEELSEYYALKGDYFLEERFRLDAQIDPKYEPYANYNSEKLQVTLESSERSKEEWVQELLKVMLDTRKEALENYQRACWVLGDETSRLYDFVDLESQPWFMDSALPLVFSGEKDSLALKFQESKEFRSKYLRSHVKATLHHKKGVAWLQWVRFAWFSGEKDMKALVNAEKEFWIAVGIDKEYKRAWQDLAKLWLFRYEKKWLNPEDRAFFLFRIREVLEFLRKDASLGNTTLFFDLGKLYYLMADLDLQERKSLQKLNLNLPLESQGYLRKSLEIYRDHLLSRLPKDSSLYGKVYQNVQQVEQELSYKNSSGLRTQDR